MKIKSETRKIKFTMHFSLVALTFLPLAGCVSEIEDRQKKQISRQNFVTTNGPVQFEFPGGWFQNEKEHPFDLQCFSKHQRMNTGVFLFAKADLAEDLAPQELLEQQIEDMRSKRKNFKVVEEKRVIQLGGKTLTTVVFSGDKGTSRNFYKFTLIQFTEHPNQIPIVLQVSIPSYWNQNKSVLEEIAASAQVLDH